jgi:predicted RecA/RadA family phage recombinase
MRNYKGSDEIVSRVAPGGGVTTGVGLIADAEFLVPEVTVAAGETYAAVKRGRVTLDSNAGDTFTAGLPVFWNDTNKDVEDTDTATNYLIGTAESAASADDEVIVCLNGGSLPEASGDLVAKANLVDLASVANGLGASLIGIEDLAGNFAAVTVEAALAEEVANLASNVNALGASLIGVEDVATNWTATDVEGVLVEIAGLMSVIETKVVTITAGNPSGATANDADWVGGTPIGCVPTALNDQIIKSVAIDGNGALTVTLDANSTAESTFNVSVVLA